MTFLTGFGRFLPGEPVGNDELEALFGPLSPRQRRVQEEALAHNGIRSRHYSLDRSGVFRFDNAGMAARAARAVLENAGLPPGDLAFLAAGTSGGDVLAPGFASMVHGRLGLPPLGLASLQSFCASGMMALQAGHHAIAAGGRPNALVVASEFASRFFRAGFFETGRFDLDAEFLRWMLSDGAGAVLLEDRPARRGLSLRLDWVDIVSHAGHHDTCMVGGARPSREAEDGLAAWGTYPTLQQAVDDGAFRLRQDLKLLDAIVPMCTARYFELIDAGRIDPDRIDYALCHISSAAFRGKMLAGLEAAGRPLDPEKLFSNLATCGNTGAASIYIMLEELVRTRPLAPGQRIVLMVPESGRFIAAYAHLTVVGPDGEAGKAPMPVTAAVPPEPAPATGSDAIRRLQQRLAAVWAAFEADLEAVPVVVRLQHGRLTLDDYRQVLFDLRQQVVEGARWIARAASSIGPDLVAVRPLFIGHSGAEQNDFRLLEEDYVALGGSLDDIRRGRKNIGSEALSAWMFQKASEPNPIDLLGAMVIIEGLGERIAGRWGAAIQDQLGLRDDQVRFLRHHAAEDEDHIAKLWSLLEQLDLTEARIDGIVACAKVTARLYRLQLEELGNR
ncbi:iron-containing redox enzyme family protein [Inquilinus sp. Marseille-Q2685]|uniref:iron-containing redox enzyme family protein n=1 Tax=Inquilinus sp. Marseille-Q2685 TaxID=2866581 RepID=UPI001CE3D365|nr:iron-containing redox enzyme family protein [Inquilinus sp. Marseille-Q2685]